MSAISTLYAVRIAMVAESEPENTRVNSTKDWTRIMRGASSPLKIFALTVLVCTTIFASAAAVLGDPLIFMYCIHMFLGLVGMFSLIAIWSPASLYHPKELKDIPPDLLPKSNRIGPTLSVVVIVLLYAIYNYMTPSKIFMVPKDFNVYDLVSGKLLRDK